MIVRNVVLRNSAKKIDLKYIQYSFWNIYAQLAKV